MWPLLRRRALDALLVVWIVGTVVFVLVRLAPGDPVSATATDPRVSPEARAAWRTQWALDGTPGQQYVRYLRGLARGELGFAISRQRPVVDVLRDALPYTMLLMGTALLLSLLAGVAIGAWQAVHADSPGDLAVGATMGLMSAVPEVWVALVLLTVLGAEWSLFPLSGHCAPVSCGQLEGWARLRELLHQLSLPALTLAIVSAAPLARVQRTALRSVLGDSVHRAAKARGASPRRLLLRHAMPRALRPVAIVVGLSFPALVGGAVFVERVFGWPGMGSVMVEAVGVRDYALVTAIAIVGSVAVTIGALLSDLAIAMLDPRYRTDG
jgi:peptide/nickel transport system permease protein